MSFKIIKGEDVTMEIHLTDEETKLPFDLTGKTVTIKSLINNVLVVFSSEVTIVNALLGVVSLSFSDTVTESIPDKAKVNLDVYIDDGTDTTIVKIYSQITVEDRQRVVTP